MRTKFYLHQGGKMLFGLLLFAFYCNTIEAQTLTAIPNPSGMYFSQYQTTDNAGNIYYSYKNGSNLFTLYKYNGSTLTAIPNPSGLTYGAFACKDNSGNLLLFYQNASFKYTMYKYNGTTLTEVPNPSGVTASGFLVIESSGNILFRYIDSAPRGHLYRYNSTTSTVAAVGGDPLPNLEGYAATDNSGIIYLKYFDLSNLSPQFVKFNGTTFTTIGNPGGRAASNYATNDNSGTIYLNYYNTSTFENEVYKYNGSTLTAITLSGYHNSVFHAKDNAGNLYFRLTNNSSSDRYLSKYDGTTLSLISNPASFTYNRYEVTDNSGNLYFRYRDASSNNFLYKYDGANLTQIPNPSGYTESAFAAKDNSGNLYFKYQDASFNGIFARLVGNTMTTVANPASLYLSAGQVVSAENDIYLRYTDASFGNATLYYYDGSLHLISNPSGLNLGNFANTDNSNNLYFYYQDGSFNGHLYRIDVAALLTWYRDMDGDGYGNPGNSTQSATQPSGYVADNTDCNDSNPLEKPGQVWYKDTDNDGYSNGMTQTQCLRPTGYKVASELTATSGDCNDNNAAIKPGATEVCDGVDNNCNSMTDEGVQTTYYRDMDNDGFGNPSVTTQSCSQPSGYVTNNTDCDDNDPLEKPGQVWYADADNDGYSTGATQTQCLRPAGYKVATELTATSGDCNDGNAAINPGATEVCDGIDNNCNSMTDEGQGTTYYRDMDMDGFGNPAVTQQACSQPSGYVANNTDCDDNDPLEKPGQVWYADADNDGYSSGATQTQCLRPTGYKVATELTATSGDCNDGNAAINPGATEVCDGIDNNCNSMTDEGAQTTYYRDMDNDGFGNPSVTTQSCSQPSGYVTNNTDCDDNDPLEKPGQTWYADADNDGYSTGATQTQCLRPTGYKAAGELTATSGDCNDGNAAINPGATEVCDGIDNNCNSMTDEGVGATYYRDMDMDGFGNPAVTQQACSQPSGYVANNTDCDDNDPLEKPGQVWYADADNDGYSSGTTQTQCLRPTGYKVAAELTATSGDCNDGNAAINPAAMEVCDGIDNNCNSMTDEGVQTTYYRDMDMDGFGDPAVNQQACSQPSGYVTNNTDCDDNDPLEKPGQVWYADADNDGYSTGATQTQCLRPTGYKVASELTATSGDCNDGNAAINPAAIELCDGIDNNCNSTTDEGVQTTYYRDMDMDGFGNPAVSQQACSLPSGYVTNNTDCDDSNMAINPNTVWYLDADNDNYYTGTGTTQCTSPGAGYEYAGLAGGSDCNDNDNTIYPGALDICDNKDNNCNGTTDEGGAGAPPGWGEGNIGGATNTSSEFDCASGSSSGTVFNINSQGFSGAANGDLINSNYQQLCGDVTLTAHIVGNPSPGWAGIYIREDLSAGSKMAGLKTNLSSFLRREVRSTTGGNKTTTQSPLYASNTWVRISRVGNTFTFYTSANGMTWTFYGSASITMNSCVYLGLFAESINAGTTITASFDNVSIVGGTTPLAAAPNLGFEVQEQHAEVDFTLYPNPTTGTVYLQLPKVAKESLQVKIFNVFGEQVGKEQTAPGEDIIECNLLNHLPDGVYWIQVRGEGFVPVIRQIVLHR